MAHLRLVLALTLGLGLVAPATAAAAAPDGLTGLALGGRVELGWQPVTGAQSYRVYRGTSEGAVTTPVSGALTARSVSVNAAPGQTHFYAVRAVVGGVESANSRIVRAAAAVRTCSSTNAVADENCLSGTTDWRIARNPGIAGFATARSIDPGGSLALKVDSEGAAYDVEIFRSGYYGGAGARLVSTILDVPSSAQPACVNDATGTGTVDCGNWSIGQALTTTTSWPSGVYLVRVVRRDNGLGNHILFVVRGDGARRSQVLYGVPDTTYQAYNAWGGKSLYPSGSGPPNTVAGDYRAVKVSFDRPYAQPTDSTFVDWYTRSDYPAVFWLERSGYDVTYASVADLETGAAVPARHDVFFSGGHDEYWSAGMRAALEAARSAGTGLFFSGANAVYWKVRFESGGRVMVCYKSTQSGGPDPSGIPTGTWRDPAGINQPENALVGGLYVGDQWGTYFPIVVSAAQGHDRLWRYTGLDTRANGAPPVSVGSALVGWEWDRRESNGVAPAGVQALATSPVTGLLVKDNGATYQPGSDISEITRYYAPSGAAVFASGTNHWNRGLAHTADWTAASDPPELGEPNVRIQQATANMLSDMGARPSTPAPSIVLDPLPAAQQPAAQQPAAVAPRRVTAKVQARWTRSARAARLKRLWVTGAPKGGRIEIRCLGKRCRAARRFRRTAKGGTVQLTKLVRHRRFPAGTTLEVRVLAWQKIGRVVRYAVKRRGLPRPRTLCLAVGGHRPGRCGGALPATAAAMVAPPPAPSAFAGPFESTEW